MPGRRSTSKATHTCDCAEYCRGAPQKVSRSTYYAHAPYRRLPPPPLPPGPEPLNSLQCDNLAGDHGHRTAPTHTTPVNFEGLSSPGEDRECTNERPDNAQSPLEDAHQQEQPLASPGLEQEVEDLAEIVLNEPLTSNDEITFPSALPAPAPPSSIQEADNLPPAVARPLEYAIPAEFTPKTEDLRVALAFKRALEDASLENGDLDEDELFLLRNPVTEPMDIDDKDIITSIKLFLSLSNVPDQSYKNVIKILREEDPKRGLLSHARVKKKLAELTGIHAIVKDMCPASCIAYTGPYEDLEKCPLCDASRFDQDKPGNLARQHFYTIPIGFFLQALWRTVAGAHNMRHRRRETEKIIQDLLESLTGLILVYNDVFHGSDYLAAVERGDIKTDDMLLMFAIDGAQLYQDKQSDCWIYIWVILDLPPELRYKKKLILPGGFIPGPNNPKHPVSFLFPGFQHLAALQKEGLKVWDAGEDRVFISRPFLLLGSADGPGSVYFTGLVGHHGAYPCRLYCGVKGRHKPGGPQYYPALLKPDSYQVAGCDHADIDPSDIGMGNVDIYQERLKFLLDSRNPTDYKTRRRDTGIATLSIFSGLSPYHRLPLPLGFPGDSMHVPTLNLGDLLVPLWRGTFTCATTDDIRTWDWAALRNEEVWRAHGVAVAACRPFIPLSYDRPPRNIAEKVNSGYKAKEWQNYFYGLAPALLHDILPTRYWQNFCQMVAAVRILHQRQITSTQLQHAYQLMCSFQRDFELMYCQRRTDRLHFMRPCLHALLHMPLETVRVGPVPLHATWTMERMIGDLGGEIAQPSNPYQNLSERGLRRSQVNALQASFTAFQEADNVFPKYSLDLDGGYAFLRAKERTARLIEDPLEANVINNFFLEREAIHGNTPSDRWAGVKVARWARLRLPNGQTARSRWKEDKLTNFRKAACVKVESSDHKIEFAEVKYYFNGEINGESEPLALVLLFSEPDSVLLRESFGTVYSVTFLPKETGLRVINAKSIQEVVAVVPHAYRVREGTEQHFFVWEKMGMDMASIAKVLADDEEVDNEEVD